MTITILLIVAIVVGLWVGASLAVLAWFFHAFAREERDLGSRR